MPLLHAVQIIVRITTTVNRTAPVTALHAMPGAQKKAHPRMGLFLTECHIIQQVIRRLQEVDWVVDDQAEVVDVAFTLGGIGTVPSLARTDGQVFQRTRLYNVLGFHVGFEVMTV